MALATAAETANREAVASAADALPKSSPIYRELIFDSIEGVKKALDTLSGEIHLSALGGLMEGAHHVRSVITDRTRGTMDRGSWVQVFGGSGTSGDADGTAKAARSTYGVAVGAEAQVHEAVSLGVGLGISSTDIDVDDRHSEAEADSMHLAVYGNVSLAPLGLLEGEMRFGAAYGWHDIETERTAAYGTALEQLESSYDAQTGQVFAEIGYDVAGLLGADDLVEGETPVIEPFGGLAYVHHRSDGFSEAGGGAALAVESSSVGLAYSTLGVRGQPDL